MKITFRTVIRLIPVSILLIAFGGCKPEAPQVVVLEYAPGQKYQEGQIQTLRRRFYRKSVTVNVGEWRMYRPDGQLWDIWIYDESGILTRQIAFGADGDTSSIFEYTADKSVTTIFGENGNVTLRDVIQYPSSADDQVVQEQTEYYETGAPARIWRSVGESESRSTVFTRDGKIVFDDRTDIAWIKERLKKP